MKEEMQELSVDDVLERQQDGIILAIRDYSSQLEDQIKDLSKNELSRLIMNAANFPLSSATNGSKERIATETLYAIKDLQVELAIHTIGEVQKEKDNE
jgi:hypothetical protein